jgi:hypothetical protein
MELYYSGSKQELIKELIQNPKGYQQIRKKFDTDVILLKLTDTMQIEGGSFSFL